MLLTTIYFYIIKSNHPHYLKLFIMYKRILISVLIPLVTLLVPHSIGRIILNENNLVICWIEGVKQILFFLIYIFIISIIIYTIYRCCKDWYKLVRYGSVKNYKK